MIYIGSQEITKIFMGSFGTPQIYIDSFKTFPYGRVTTGMTNVSVVYSSGSAINAAGSNYAYIQGTLITYVDGVQTSTETVKLTPSFVSTPSWGASIVSNNIYGPDRDTVTGSSRTATVKGTYSGYTSGNLTVSQAANSVTRTAGEITAFHIQGVSGQTTPTDYQAKTLNITQLAGYKNLSYSSGAHSTESITAFTATSNQSWATVNFTGQRPTSVSITANNSTTEVSRSATITVRDAEFTNVTKTATIVQETYNAWELSVAEQVVVGSDQTEFFVTVTSRRLGQPFAITTSNVTVSPNNSNIVVSSVTDMTSGYYRVYFTCSKNTGTSQKSSTITVTAGPNSVSCIAKQDAYGTFEGMHVHYRFGDWALGTIKTALNTGPGSAYDVAGIMVAKKTAVTGTAQVSISLLQYEKYNSGGTGTYTVTGITDTITAGQTQTVTAADYGTTKTYYGDWLQNFGPTLGLDIRSVSAFIVTET